MPEIASSPISTYLAPEATRRARDASVIGVEYDPSQLESVFRIVEDSGGPLTPDLTQPTTFIVRYAYPGRPQRGDTLDHPFANAGPGSLYVPADALQSDRHVNAIAKSDLSDHSQIYEVDVRTFDDDRLMHYLATSLLYPPAEDQRLRARPSAWWQQAKDALAVTAEKQRRAVLSKIVGNYAGAAVFKYGHTS